MEIPPKATPEAVAPTTPTPLSDEELQRVRTFNMSVGEQLNPKERREHRIVAGMVGGLVVGAAGTIAGITYAVSELIDRAV